MSDFASTPCSTTVSSGFPSAGCYNFHALENRGVQPPPPRRRENPLSAEQRLALHLLAQGQSDSQAAHAAHVHRTTVTRWRLYHPTFQTQLNRHRQALYSSALDRLRSLLAPSLDLLQHHLSSASERAAFRAAISILRLAGCHKSSVPTGPTDEYDLLEQLHARDQQLELQANNRGYPWPPSKSDLDSLRHFYLLRARNEPIPPEPSPSSPSHPSAFIPHPSQPITPALSNCTSIERPSSPI